MSSVEDIGHILAGCPQMSSRFYLPLRHDEVAKTFLYSHIKKYNLNKKIRLSNESEYIYTEKPREYWFYTVRSWSLVEIRPTLQYVNGILN